MQQPVFKLRFCNIHAISQCESALELSRSYASVQKDAGIVSVVLLLAMYQQLAFLYRNRQILFAKPGQGKRDAKRVRRGYFDIEWRIAVCARPSRAFNQPFEPVETQQQRV